MKGNLLIIATVLALALAVSCKNKEDDETASFLKNLKQDVAKDGNPIQLADQDNCSPEAFDHCYDDALKYLRQGKNDKAKEFFEIGCNNGHLGSCARFDSLSNVAGKGPITQKLYSDTEASCNNGANDACFDLGFYEINVGNKERAKMFNTKACDNGVYGACYNAGIQAVELGSKDEAKTLYKKACDNGYFRGCFNLGVVFSDDGNVTEAKAYYEKGCDGGDIFSCTNLGILESRNGDKGKGERLLKKSCSAGDKVACNNLETMK